MRRTCQMAAYLLLADARGEPAFSRNRHFDAHRDPRFLEAIALARRLRALLVDLERAPHDGTTVCIEDGPVVRLSFRGPRLERACLVPRDAWEVLLLHPRGRAALAGLRASAA